MPSQHPEEVGYGRVVESYVTRMYGGLPRYLVLNGGRFLGPRWWHTTRFTRHLLNDAAAITDEELEALLGYEWRSRLTAAWLIGVDRRERFRARIGDLLLASEVCYSGGAYCFALRGRWLAFRRGSTSSRTSTRRSSLSANDPLS
ncbi:DUF6000 family protein [Streptomyces sp. NPDC001621]|uniref:DUF6000 family protein n=1 Tax=Streptomyces sp. NPDC001621 TaxID=3364594 RepID=UPI0036B0677A